MPLDKKKLMARLSAASKTKPATPALPKTPAIKAAEKIEQQVKKATGVDKLEKEVERNVAKAGARDVKTVAEQSLSPALIRKLLSGEKLTSDDQKQIAAVCKQIGYL